MRVFITLSFILTIFLSCDTRHSADDDPHSTLKNVHSYLQGTWKQVSSGSTKTSSITDLKFFIGNRVAFVSYDVDKRVLSSATGGTFSLNGLAMKEEIEYSSIDNGSVGAHFSYQYKLQGDTLVLFKDNKQHITEKYVKLEDAVSGQNKLEGVWQMSLCRYGNSKDLAPNATGTHAIKILTPTHFMVVHFDVLHKHFVGISGGAYSHFDDTYVEHIHYNSRDASAVGGTAEFTYALAEGTLHKKGYIDSEKFPSLYIEEIFERLPEE